MNKATVMYRSAHEPSTGEAVTLVIWKNPVCAQEQLAMQGRVAPWLDVPHYRWVNVQALEFFQGHPVLVLDPVPETARRLSQVPCLAAPQVLDFVISALIAWETLRLGGIRHGRICPDAFVELGDRWVVLPDMAIDPASCMNFHQPPIVPFWSPWHWLNRFRKPPKPASPDSEFEQVLERNAVFGRHELIALARTISFASSGSGRIERRPWRSACPDLEPLIANVLEHVARDRGPAGPSEFRSVMMGDGAKMPMPKRRSQTDLPDSEMPAPLRSDWSWLAPILQETLAADSAAQALPSSPPTFNMESLPR